jgi:hypothetical protein
VATSTEDQIVNFRSKPILKLWSRQRKLLVLSCWSLLSRGPLSWPLDISLAPIESAALVGCSRITLVETYWALGGKGSFGWLKLSPLSLEILQNIIVYNQHQDQQPSWLLPGLSTTQRQGTARDRSLQPTVCIFPVPGQFLRQVEYFLLNRSLSMQRSTLGSCFYDR